MDSGEKYFTKGPRDPFGFENLPSEARGDEVDVCVCVLFIKLSRTLSSYIYISIRTDLYLHLSYTYKYIIYIRVQHQVVEISKKHQIKISRLDYYVKWNFKHILFMTFFDWRSSSCPNLRFFAEMSIICGFDVRTYWKCCESRLFQTFLSAEYNYLGF